MFSGIVEEMATVTAIVREQENIHITLRCSFTAELKIDQSIAHNGVCLTVVAIDGDCYTVMNGRLDGHIVQGHVDQTALCTAVTDADGSTYYDFTYHYDRAMAHRGYFTVDKGSVTVNGVSLTVCQPTDNSFRVAIIPYTREHTNIGEITVGSTVNIEFDILGKYIARLQSLQ